MQPENENKSSKNVFRYLNLKNVSLCIHTIHH